MRRVWMVIMAVVLLVGSEVAVSATAYLRRMDFVVRNLEYRPKPKPTLVIPTPRVGDEPGPIDVSEITPDIRAKAQVPVDSPYTAESFVIQNAWYLRENLRIAAGHFDPYGRPGLLVQEGDSVKLVILPISGAPGPADIKGLKGNLVLVDQGRGYFVYDVVSGEVATSDEHGNPGKVTIIHDN